MRQQTIGDFSSGRQLGISAADKRTENGGADQSSYAGSYQAGEIKRRVFLLWKSKARIPSQILRLSRPITTLPPHHAFSEAGVLSSKGVGERE